MHEHHDEHKDYSYAFKIGVIINGITALLFMSGRKSDLNIRGAFLHMVADAGVSTGVVLAGLGIIVFEWQT